MFCYWDFFEKENIFFNILWWYSTNLINFKSIWFVYMFCCLNLNKSLWKYLWKFTQSPLPTTYIEVLLFFLRLKLSITFFFLFSKWRCIIVSDFGETMSRKVNLEGASLNREFIHKYNTCFYSNEKSRSSRSTLLSKTCSQEMQQIYRRTLMSKCDLNKVAKQLYRNHTSAWVLSCKFAAYFFKKHFSTTAAE